MTEPRCTICDGFHATADCPTHEPLIAAWETERTTHSRLTNRALAMAPTGDRVPRGLFRIEAELQNGVKYPQTIEVIVWPERYGVVTVSVGFFGDDDAEELVYPKGTVARDLLDAWVDRAIEDYLDKHEDTMSERLALIQGADY